MLLFKQLFRTLKKLLNLALLKKNVLPLLMSHLSKLLLPLFVDELDTMVLPNIVQLKSNLFVTFSAMILNIQLDKLFLRVLASRLMDASICPLHPRLHFPLCLLLLVFTSF